jgi:hypothetical protein
MMLLSNNHAHFNPANAGAVVALDARFLTGLADGDGVATWAGRPGTSVSPTSVGGAQRPVYKTSVVNGQPAVRFDGVQNCMSYNAVLTDLSHLTVLSLLSSSPSYGTIWITETGRIVTKLSGSNWGTYAGGDKSAGESFPLNTPTQVSNFYDSTNTTIRRDGAAKTTFAGDDTGSGTSFMGNELSYSRFINADICADIIFASAISDALRRRIEQSLAFSFRLACA